MSQKKNKTYPDEFKKEAVRMALESGKPKTAVAKELGVGLSLLYTWIKQQTEAESMGVDQVAEAKRVKDLEIEIKRLRSENALLKKAAAYFAKDQL